MQKTNLKMLNRVLPLFLALSLLFSTPALAAENGPYGVILSWTGDTATTMTASWRDNAQSPEIMQVVSGIQYDKTGFAGAMEFAAGCKGHKPRRFRRVAL